MQKVVGSSPIIRSSKGPGNGAFPLGGAEVEEGAGNTMGNTDG
jgi:hypothetical protein